MYYVAKNYPPYWPNRLNQSEDLEAMKSWASKEARKRGEWLYVREGDFPGFRYGKVRATFNDKGQEV